MLHPTKGIQHTKNRHLDNMRCTIKNHMPQFYAKTRLPYNPKTFTFSAEQLVNVVANVAIQAARPQVFYANATHDTIDKKSSLCRRVFEAAKNHLGVDITGMSLFDAIGQLRHSAPSASKPKTSLAKGETSFKFISSTKVVKPSAILKSLSPPPPPPPLAQLTRLSPNSLNPLNRTPSKPSLMTGI